MYAFDYARPADQAAATSTASSGDVRYLPVARAWSRR